MSTSALEGVGNLVSKISSNLTTLKDVLGLDQAQMASGLRPVYRLTTSKDLSDGLVTDYVLANTIPDWVKVKSLGKDYPAAKFGTEVLKKILEEKVSNILGIKDLIQENPVIGILMDESPKNIYRYLVDIIFANVPYEAVDGKRKWLSEDFLQLGFPMQLSMGFIDVDGNFIRHPNEPAVSTYGEIPPDFTGLLGAVTQETFAAGDFFQGTFVGFEYLLARYRPQEDFPIKTREPVTRTLARMLRWLASRSTLQTGKSRRLTAGDATLPIPILRAMGVMEPKSTRILSTEEIRKTITLIDMPNYGKKPSASRNTIRNGWDIPTWYGFDGVLEVIAKNTNTDIYFNEYGRLVVSGKPRVRQIATNRYDRIRVHDAIIGSNVLHHQATIDLSQIMNRVIVHKVFSGINAESPTLTVVDPNAAMTFTRDDVTRYYAEDKSFGTDEIYYYAGSEDYGEEASSVIEQLIDYYRYYGMRGTVFMIGNPKIRVGDVVRVSDIRSFTISGRSDYNARANLSDEIKWTIINAESADLDWDPPIERSVRLSNSLDHFFIWKVLHYVGPDGFKTKVFYTKERDSYRPGSDLLAQHIRRRRRGIAGEFK